MRTLKLLTLCKEAASSIWPPAKRKEKQPLSLMDLPTEILQHIASFLPTSSAAAFALCSHSLSRVLGSQYWTKLREPHQKERDEFLALVEKDLPDYILCQRCAKLHRPDRRGTAEICLSSKQHRPCFDADFLAHLFLYYHDRLRFEHVQMAMKQHRLGLNSGLHLDYLSTLETDNWSLPYTHQKSMKARIVSNSFLVRIQDRLLIPAEEVVKTIPIYYLRLCRHLSSFSKDDRLSKLLRCRLDHSHDQHPCSTCNGLKQCRYCPTEFQIDHKSFGKQGMVIFITRWLNFGAGLTPSDPNWKSHAFDVRGTGVYQNHEFDEGSIQSAFELKEHFLFESIMTSDNFSELLHTR